MLLEPPPLLIAGYLLSYRHVAAWEAYHDDDYRERHIYHVVGDPDHGAIVTVESQDRLTAELAAVAAAKELAYIRDFPQRR